MTAPDVVTALVAEFQAANAEAIELVLGPARGCWQLPTAAEGWPVGVTARHIALGHELMAGWARGLAAGRSIELAPDIHEQNAEAAALGVVADPEEVAELLRVNAVGVEAALRALRPQDLEGDVEFGGQQLPAGTLAAASARHVRGHLDSIRAVIAGQTV